MTTNSFVIVFSFFSSITFFSLVREGDVLISVMFPFDVCKPEQRRINM